MDHYVRAAVLEGFTFVLRRLGVDGNKLLIQAGISEFMAVDPNSYIDYERFLYAQELAFQATGRDDIGLLFAQHQRLEVLGMLGRVLTDAPSLRDAINGLNELITFHTTGLTFYGYEENDYFRLGISAANPDWPGIEYSIDRAITMGVMLVSTHLGRSWLPQSMSFSRPRPMRIDKFHEVFGYNLHFGRSANEMLIDKKSLDSLSNLGSARSFERITEMVGFEIENTPRRLHN